METYTKLFNSIMASSIWTEDDHTRILWISMLAMADKNGEIHASVPGLARLANIPIASCEKALEKFKAPDKYSRTTTDEGRRIEEIEGGWAVINHAKYRLLASKQDSKEKNAQRQKRFRDRQQTVTNSNATVTHRNATVTHSNATVTQDRDIADTEADKEVTYTPTCPPETDFDGLWKAFPSTSRIRSTKHKLREAIKKAKNTPPIQELTKSVLEWAKCDQWTKDGGQYAPGAHLFIKDRKWEDTPEIGGQTAKDYSIHKDGTRIDGGIVVGGKLIKTRN